MCRNIFISQDYRRSLITGIGADKKSLPTYHVVMSRCQSLLYFTSQVSNHDDVVQVSFMLARTQAWHLRYAGVDFHHYDLIFLYGCRISSFRGVTPHRPIVMRSGHTQHQQNVKRCRVPSVVNVDAGADK